jgi:DNA-binding MarR family transcriptional regulator
MIDFDEILVALRRIIRATDLHAKQVARATGLTPSQLLVLQTIRELGEVAISRVAKEMNLSQATVTTLIDRLAARGLVYRQRNDDDKRVVHALLTEAGVRVLAQAPPALQQQLSHAFEALAPWERHWLVAALQRVGQMLQADAIDASPVLDVGAIDRAPGVAEVLHRSEGRASTRPPGPRPRRS